MIRFRIMNRFWSVLWRIGNNIIELFNHCRSVSLHLCLGTSEEAGATWTLILLAWCRKQSWFLVRCLPWLSWWVGLTTTILWKSDYSLGQTLSQLNRALISVFPVLAWRDHYDMWDWSLQLDFKWCSFAFFDTKYLLISVSQKLILKLSLHVWR